MFDGKPIQIFNTKRDERHFAVFNHYIHKVITNRLTYDNENVNEPNITIDVDNFQTLV